MIDLINEWISQRAVFWYVICLCILNITLSLRYLFGRFYIEKAIVALHIHRFLSNEKWIIEEKALYYIDLALSCNYAMQIK